MNAPTNPEAGPPPIQPNERSDMNTSTNQPTDASRATTTAADRAAAATDVGEFLTALDGGVLERKLAVALSHVAAAVMDHDRSGEVVLRLTIERLDGAAFQCRIKHALKFTRPTEAGKVSEDEERATVMWVGQYGRLTVLPPGTTFGGQRSIPHL